MKQKTIKRIDSMIEYLKMVRNICTSVDSKEHDALAILSLVSIGLEATYQDIKNNTGRTRKKKTVLQNFVN